MKKVNQENKNNEEVETKHLLSKKDIFKTWFLWMNTVEMSNSFERLQSLAFAACISPVLKALYKDDEQLSAALKRHLTFFNTEGVWGAMIPGIAVAMEEQRAAGENISDEMITGVKTGFMGPLAGIGDTVDWGTVRPIVLGLFLPLATAGNWFAGLGPFLIQGAISATISWNMYYIGYRTGRKGIMSVLKNGRINQVITAAGILGLFMMGVLSSQYVKLSLKPKITIAGKATAIQSFVDKIVPGILPLLMVFVVYYMISKKKVKLTTCMLVLLAVAMLGSFIGLF